MPQLQLPTGFYEDRSKPISNQNLVNFYVNLVEAEGALSKVTYYGSPGISQLATTGSTAASISRGSWTFDDVFYSVNGGSLYSLDRALVGSTETFAVTEIGAIAGESRVSIASNNTQMMILVPGSTAYIYDGSTLSTITDSDFTASGDPQYVVFIDGYFACNTDEKKWIISDLNDGTSWNPLLFSTAESDPDAIVAPVVNDNTIYMVGSETTEGFRNLGGFGHPFQRDGTFLDKGCAAPFTLVNANQAFFMVGGGKKETVAIWMFEKNDFVKISTTAIDNLLATYTDTAIGNAFAMAYSLSGAYKVAFTFPAITLEYDMATNQWSERTSYYNENESKWRVNSINKAYGRIITTDAVDGRIGELSLDEYGEYGNDIHSYFRMQPFANGSKPVSIPRIELTCESGVGNSTVDEPYIYMATSRDSKNFSHRRNRSLGKVGENKQRQIWNRNGRFPRWAVLEFGITDQVKKVIIKMET